MDAFDLELQIRDVVLTHAMIDEVRIEVIALDPPKVRIAHRVKLGTPIGVVSRLFSGTFEAPTVPVLVNGIATQVPQSVQTAVEAAKKAVAQASRKIVPARQVPRMPPGMNGPKALRLTLPR